MKKTCLLLLFSCCLLLSNGQEKRYTHILITNDDGIEDADRLLALARSVSKVADRVSIVVASQDRSGSSNYMQFGKHSSVLEVECRYTESENNISVYTLNAFPADCILIGLGGLFGDDRPELVLSGINGGSNIGPGWFASGTVGAVRMATYLGVKAIALSGFDDDYESAYEVIPDWITRLIASDHMDLMTPNSYLTIGFPKTDPSKIKGVRVAGREISYIAPRRLTFTKIMGDEPHVTDNSSVWAIGDIEDVVEAKLANDMLHLNEGFIVVTPMTIDENNQNLLERFKEVESQLPVFR